MIFSSCSSENQTDELSKTLGINLDEGTIIENLDTHGGFHGDGYTYIKISFKDDLGKIITDEIKNNEDWCSLPFTDNLHTAVYGKETNSSSIGPIVTKNEGQILFPSIKNGYYFFFNRQNGNSNPKDDSNFFNQYSYNFTIALYDPNENVLYYYELDT